MVVLLLWSLVLAVVVPPRLVTVVESGCLLFMFSSLCVVLSEEGCSVGSPVFKEVPSTELFLGFSPLTVVEFPPASSLVVSFPLPVVLVPLPVDLGCKLPRSSHPAAPPLMMF